MTETGTNQASGTASFASSLRVRLACVPLVAVECAAIDTIFTRYAYPHRPHEAGLFFLFGGVHSAMFWVGLIFVGCVVPAVLLFIKRTGTSVRWTVFASALVVIGVLGCVVFPTASARADEDFVERLVAAALERLEQAGATELIAMEFCGTEAEAVRTREFLRRLL